MIAEPFAVPASVGAGFAAIRGYWNSLKRGSATIPFTDDFRPSALGKLSEVTALVDVFENPRRYRFSAAGQKVRDWYGSELEDQFADEIALKPPLDAFASQSSATVELGAPTFYRHSPEHGPGYRRLMLPLWGDGHCNAILTAFESMPSGAAK